MPMLEELVRSRFLQEEAVDFSLQAMLKVHNDEGFLELGRTKSRNRVQERTDTALTALRDSAPGKAKNKPKD